MRRDRFRLKCLAPTVAFIMDPIGSMIKGVQFSYSDRPASARVFSSMSISSDRMLPNTKS